jgi:transposase InsO family protein
MALHRAGQAHPERLRGELQRALQRRCLNDTLFSTLSEARSAINSWKEDYNHHRPHSALGNMPPAEFAMKSTLEKQAA